YVEFTTTGSQYQYVICGLSNGDSNQNYPDVDFGFYPAATNLYVIEGGTTHLVSSYAVGDTLRVAVESGVVKYRKNGAVVYTSTISPTYPLLVDTAFYQGGISNAMLSTGSQGGGSGTQNASWTNAVGVSVSGNNLTKTAADGWNNSGASSTQTIASGDGYVEFTASETTTARMCGLAHSDLDQNYGIDFALGVWPGGTLYRFEFGVYSVIGTYATGDVLRVAVEGGVVKYRKNGTLLYTSTVTPTYPLLADTSLYSNGATLNNVVINGAAGGGGGSSANVKWLVTDQLGTPRMIFDQTGSLTNVSRHDYLPFGEELFAGIGGRTTNQGYSQPDGVRQKFTKYERDNETGLDFAQARYYAATQGRFTSADPLMASGRVTSPQTWNRYSYGNNNPLRFTDPTGMVPGDYYDLNGNKLGTDGKDDKKVHIVYDKDKQKKLEERNSVTIPDAAKVIPAIGEMVEASNSKNGDDVKGGFHEESLVADSIGNNDVQISRFTGPYSPDPSKGAEVVSTTTEKTALQAHVHPAGLGKTVIVDDPAKRTGGGTVVMGGTMTTITPAFRQEPSIQSSNGGPGDIPKALPNATNIAVGARSKQVYFYNTGGTFAQMSLKNFLKIRK
ncbi:MAG TPA: RHS repeat-associated core domain-containing protein, partial [Pyrinomonadaceae bacterium]|nr:RHS repeat-associated core domain-containing protein [Pyrinomonadaceae bacterium]